MSTVGMADADVRATLSQWLLLNHGRHVLVLVGWLAALKAFSLYGQVGDRHVPPLTSQSRQT